MFSSEQEPFRGGFTLSTPLSLSSQKHGVELAHEHIQQSGMTQLLVRKCSKGTGFSKLWLLRDLEILSIMLYSSKREINSMAQDPERDQREHDKEHDSDHSSYAEDADVNKADPLEGLDEETKICFQVTIFLQSLSSEVWHF